MPQQNTPVHALAYGWDYGEDGWKEGHDATIVKLDGLIPLWQPYDIGLTVPGVLADADVLLRYPMPRAVDFPADLTGSRCIAAVAATASTVLSIKKNGGEFGTATFGAAGTSATLAAASSVSFAAGDVLTIEGPATADVTLADLGMALVGTR
jgi:hypothetical protein